MAEDRATEALSREEIEKLPRRAQMALAARCVQRVLPATGARGHFSFWGRQAGECLQAMETVVHCLCLLAVGGDDAHDGINLGGDTSGQVEGGINDALDLAGNTADAAFAFAASADVAASAAAKFAAAAKSATFAAAAYAAAFAAGADAAISAAMSAARADFSWLLQNCSDDPDALIPKEFFHRSLWPSGVPERWAVVVARWRKALNKIGLESLGARYSRALEGEPVDWDDINSLVADWARRHNIAFPAGPPVNDKESTASGSKETQGETSETQYVASAPVSLGGVGTLAPDGPSDRDCLNRMALVDALAAILKLKPPLKPVVPEHGQASPQWVEETGEGMTIALLGEWGEGKSTIFHLLKKHLREYDGEKIKKGRTGWWHRWEDAARRMLRLREAPVRRFIFTEYNAWKHEQTVNIPAGLAQAVTDAMLDEISFFRRYLVLPFAYAIRKNRYLAGRLLLLFLSLAVVLLGYLGACWVRGGQDSTMKTATTIVRPANPAQPARTTSTLASAARGPAGSAATTGTAVTTGARPPLPALAATSASASALGGAAPKPDKEDKAEKTEASELAALIIKLLGAKWAWLAVVILALVKYAALYRKLKAEDFKAYLKIPSFKDHLGLIPVFRKHLEILGGAILGEDKGGGPRHLVVFIDDLDRCQPDYIANVFDAVRLLISMENTTVLVGIDPRIAFKAMEQRYEKLADGEREKCVIARDYLSKIIQLPIRLTPPGDGERKDYIIHKLFPDAVAGALPQGGEPSPASSPAGGGPAPRPAAAAAAKAATPDDKPQPGPAPSGRQPEPPPDNLTVTDEDLNKVMKETKFECDLFVELAEDYGFGNPRQLLRLRNSYRFLKTVEWIKLPRPAVAELDRRRAAMLLRLLFWQEFLHTQPREVRFRCMAAIAGVETTRLKPMPEADKAIADLGAAPGFKTGIREVSELFKSEPDVYQKEAKRVRAVVLPHCETGVPDTLDEINAWLAESRKAAEDARQAAANANANGIGNGQGNGDGDGTGHGNGNGHGADHPSSARS